MPEAGAPAAFYTERPESDGWSPSGAKSPQVIAGHSGVYHNRYHNSGLPAQPLACKLLIRKTRRDVRVVEGARLESVCRGNSTEGSNPSLSATSTFYAFDFSI